MCTILVHVLSVPSYVCMILLYFNNKTTTLAFLHPLEVNIPGTLRVPFDP